MFRVLWVGNPSVPNAMARESIQDFAEVDDTTSLQEAWSKLDSQNYDLAIVESHLPDGSGLDFLRKLKQGDSRTELQVMIVGESNENGEQSMEVSAFKMGAEDFVWQPLHFESFRARVEARLLRSPRSMDDSMCLQYGNLMIELETQKAYVLENGQKTEVPLTGREFKILYLLARKENHVLSRAELIQAIWGGAVHVLDRTVDTHVYTLRKKLGAYSIYIQSEVGVGYRFATGQKNQKGLSDGVKPKSRERMVA